MLAGPISFLVVFGFLVVITSIDGPIYNLFWLLVVPGIFVNKPTAIFMGWALSVFLISSFHHLPYFRKRVWACVSAGLVVYYVIIVTSVVIRIAYFPQSGDYFAP
jgi:hypothetical protein